MFDVLVLGLGSYLYVSAICVPEIIPEVVIIPSISEIKVERDFSRQELLDLSKATAPSEHEGPLGFYSSKLGYSLDVSIASAKIKACPPTVSVKIGVVLGPRIIEIARDLPGGACSIDVILEYYRRIAIADENVTRERSIELSSDVQQMLMKFVSDQNQTVTIDKKKQFLEKNIKDSIQRQAIKTRAQRIQAQKNAKSTEMPSKLISKCNSNI